MTSFINRFFRQQNDNSIMAVNPSATKGADDYQPLLDLQDKRQLVEIKVLGESCSQTYQSMIVRLNFLQREIYLDAFTPYNPYFPVTVGDRLILNHHEHGRILFIEGKLLDIVHEDNTIYYVMELPNEIGYKQRRFFRRFLIDKPNLVKMRLWSPLRIPWYTKVKNISAGGARLTIGGNICSSLQKNCVLPNCDIELNSGQHICCKATVKAYRYHRRPYEHTEVSVEFLDLGYQQKNWLLQWVEFNSYNHLKINDCL